jgi:hypothetical protein
MSNHLSHSLQISQISVRGETTTQNIFGNIDQLGLLVGLERRPGEQLQGYKARLLDTYRNRANATYTGMINAITRELSLSLFKPFRINPRRLGNEFVAPDPRIIFNGPVIELYSDWENSVLEMTIDRYEQTEDSYYLGDLANHINANSTVFEVDFIENYLDKRSMCLLNQTNVRKINSELIQTSNRFTLNWPGQRGGKIRVSTIFFNEPVDKASRVFVNRVNSFSQVLNSGDWYVNEYTGEVLSKKEPHRGTTVRYEYIIDLWQPVASPVIIHDLNNFEFKKKMFEQILQDDGTITLGVPTPFGADLINELMSVYPLYYDK